MRGLPPLTKCAGATTRTRRSGPATTVEELLTIGGGESPSPPYRTDRLRFCAIGELEPVRCVGLEVCGFHLEREVDVVARERFARIEWLSMQLRVVEDLEGNAERDAFFWVA